MIVSSTLMNLDISTNNSSRSSSSRPSDMINCIWLINCDIFTLYSVENWQQNDDNNNNDDDDDDDDDNDDNDDDDDDDDNDYEDSKITFLYVYKM